MTDYSTKFLGKPLSKLKAEDIVVFFETPKDETNHLEFKSFGDPLADFNKGFKGVVRSIAAFLNSEGGLLIWGAPKGRKIDESIEDRYQGELTPIEKKGKDQLVNKISDLISPMPMAYEVEIVDVGDKVVYVFEVQESAIKPHQFDHVYSIRLDGQTKPAPHYIVQALMRQVTYPDIRGVIKLDSLSQYPDKRYILQITIAIFNCTELQNEESVSFTLLITKGVFYGSTLVNQKRDYHYNLEGRRLVNNNFANVLHFGTPNIFQEQIMLDFTKNKDAGPLKMVLAFGGKKSPAKSSTYTLNTKVLRNTKNLNKSFVDIAENISFSAEAKVTAEDSIKHFTGRPPQN